MTYISDVSEINFKEKFNLGGKVVIISGGCGLIGRAFCEAVVQFLRGLVNNHRYYFKDGRFCWELTAKF